MDKSSSDVYTCFGLFFSLHQDTAAVVVLSLQFITVIILLDSKMWDSRRMLQLLQLTKDILENSSSLVLNFSQWNNGKTIKYSTFRRSDYDWLYYLMHFTKFIGTSIPSRDVSMYNVHQVSCAPTHHSLCWLFSRLDWSNYESVARILEYACLASML